MPIDTRQICSKLTSDKVKERVEGLDQIHQSFERDHVVRRFDPTGTVWLSLFQALFEAVVKERTTALTKGIDNTTYVKRLERAASTVRWLAARSVIYLNKSAVRSILEHVLQAITHRNALLRPIATEYLATILTLLRYQPHADQLSNEMWNSILSLAIAAMLGLSPSYNVADDEDDDEEAEEDMDVDDETEPTASSHASRKRARRSPTAPSKRRKVTSSQGQDHVICAEIVRIMLRPAYLPSGPAMRPPAGKEDDDCQSRNAATMRRVLYRLQQFFAQTATESSAHADVLLTVSNVLSYASLNCRDIVVDSGHRVWASLLSRWGTKVPAVKESLVLVFRQLLPFVVPLEDVGPHHAAIMDDVQRLTKLVEADSDARVGSIELLNLDTLDLFLDEPLRRGAFCSRTFAAGFEFSAAQAVTWAALELQADCLNQLFLFSERMHDAPTQARRPDPITAFLSDVSGNSTAERRRFRLQTLLFFIERHWGNLHQNLQSEVAAVLATFQTHDDSDALVWSFLCSTAISSVAGTISASVDWDTLWGHATRRMNTGPLSRAACHVALALIQHKRVSDLQIRTEIESLARDISIQGPAFPFDSVCQFISKCLSIARADARLYKLQLEEHVVVWLADSWQLLDAEPYRRRAHAVPYLLALLQNICGLADTDSVSIVTGSFLPDGMTVRTMVDEYKTRRIHDFLLHARLPTLDDSSGRESGDSSVTPRETDGRPPTAELEDASPRARKCSAFLLRTLEALSPTLSTPITAAHIRRALDLAVVALLFETSLELSGVRPTRRLISVACEVISVLRGSGSGLQLGKWTVEERAMILCGLDPIVCFRFAKDNTSGGGEGGDEDVFEVLVRPIQESGIERRKLVALRRGLGDQRGTRMRHELLKLLWSNTVLQDEFQRLSESLHSILKRHMTGQAAAAEAAPKERHDEEKDADFMAVRIRGGTSAPIALSVQATVVSTAVSPYAPARYLLSRAVRLLLAPPQLQSVDGAGTKDKKLLQYLVDCEGVELLHVSEELTRGLATGSFDLSHAGLLDLLDTVGHFLQLHSYARDEAMACFIIDLLLATINVWVAPTAQNDIAAKVYDLCVFFARTATRSNSWVVRHRWAGFLAKYIDNDPALRFWLGGDEQQNKGPTPVQQLLHLVGDDDVRVRVRAGVCATSLFRVVQRKGDNIEQFYSTALLPYLARDIHSFEAMASRILALGNFMIVNSAVRRGPFWHLLEPLPLQIASGQSLPGRRYMQHIQSTLTAVAERLGMESLARLFDAYSLQLAVSLSQARKEMFLIPPQVLGYPGRREMARSSFAAVGPVLLVTGALQNDQVSQAAFQHYCESCNVDVPEGSRLCFARVMAFKIVFAIDRSIGSPPPLELPAGFAHEMLQELITYCTLCQVKDAVAYLQLNVDAVVADILGTLGDIDHSLNGSIAKALSGTTAGGAVATTFGRLMKFRSPQDFAMHGVNIPAMRVTVVLFAIDWLRSQVKGVDAEATIYHVVQRLFAAINQTPLVNEKMRLMHGLCVWIALNHASFVQPVILRTLMLGATTLLAVADLAHFAQSIIDWSFEVYRSHVKRTKDPAFPDVVSRMGRIAHAYTHDPHDSATRSLGHQLLSFLESQLETFASNDALEDQVAVIIHLWPRDPSEELVHLNICARRPDIVETILSDGIVSSSRFRLVRRMWALARQGLYQPAAFSNVDFWKIKHTMPSDSDMSDSDLDAFVGLLSLSGGQLHPTFNATGDSSKPDRAQTGLGKATIVHSLLSMLQHPETRIVNTAYSTLRRLVPLAKQEINVATHAKAEVAFLATSPLELHHREPRAMSSLEGDSSLLSLAGEFDRWIQTMTVVLADVLAADDPFWSQLHVVLECNSSFAATAFPILIHHVLLRDYSTMSNSIEETAKFVLTELFTSVLKAESVSADTLRSIITAVIHLRNFTPPGNDDPLAYEKWLAVDFELLSRGAIRCGAYTTAVLFLEVCGELSGDHEAATPEDVLFEIYSRIDEPDGFYGVRGKDSLNSLIRRFQHERDWSQAFHFHGAQFEGSRQRSTSQQILNSLHAFGFDNLAMAVLQANGSSTSPGEEEEDIAYRLGWRTDTWDLPDPPADSPSNVCLYRTLRAVHRERDPAAVDETLAVSLRREVDRLRSIGDENVVQMRETVQTLLCLGEIRRWQATSVRLAIAQRDVGAAVWDDLTLIPADLEFPDFEALLATRMSVLRSIRLREEREQIGNAGTPFIRGLMNAEAQCLVRLSQEARETSHLQIALNAIVSAQHLQRWYDHLPRPVVEEFASVLWSHGERKMAFDVLWKQIQRETTTSTADNLLPGMMALLYARAGGWATAAQLELPSAISEKYFGVATSLLVTNDHIQATGTSDTSQALVFHQCAKFAEHQYHELRESRHLQTLETYLKLKKEQVDYLVEVIGGDQTHYLARDLGKTRTLYNQDSAAIAEHHRTRDAFRDQAIEMFSRCLQASDEFDDDAAIRLCSIWTAHFTTSDGDRLHGVVRDALQRVPSHKFVFLSHQLSARLLRQYVQEDVYTQQVRGTNVVKQKVKDREYFRAAYRILQDLIRRMGSEHPYHTLYQLHFLCQPPGSNEPAVFERGVVAKEILTALERGTNGERVSDVQRVCAAYLQWATFKLKKNALYPQKKPVHTIPQHTPITVLRSVKIPVSTIPTPVDKTLQYADIIYIHRYAGTFTLAGGLNLPKITECEGSDGLRYKQLFKGEGNDDLRQDALMEQVFHLCNKMLRKDRLTLKRKLAIRPYMVIPLSPTAGMLEFVGNTQPLGDWLAAGHKKYRPEEPKGSACQGRLRTIREKHRGPSLLPMLDAEFHKITEEVKPVFRFFFYEQHKDPIGWFNMRLNYSRSAASSSIIGHVLGLGDRHVSNILIDKSTGELVHIDLGIAFEQGKLLPVPETVPFRLTRDIVDGLGSTGVEGVFRRCAEHTLRVLRDGNEIIKLVLEVLKHDPLHSWVSASKFTRAQADASEPAHATNTGDRYGIGIGENTTPELEAADRALTSVARKLDASISVEYVVNDLIMTAANEKNLGRIFQGWNPQY